MNVALHQVIQSERKEIENVSYHLMMLETSPWNSLSGDVVYDNTELSTDLYVAARKLSAFLVWIRLRNDSQKARIEKSKQNW